MLSDPEAELCIYIAADTTKARTLWSECVRDFFKLQPAPSMARLRTVWVPSDLDADNEADRSLVQDLLWNGLAQDVLLNVILGNLTREAVAFFTSSTGRVGADLVVLSRIAVHGFTNVARLSDAVGLSSSSLRERLTRLLGCGFLRMPDPTASYFHATLRGRVFLELCHQLQAPNLARPELQRILRLLGLVDSLGDTTNLGGALSLRINDAVHGFDLDLTPQPYHAYWESPAWPPSLPRPAGWREALDQ